MKGSLQSMNDICGVYIKERKKGHLFPKKQTITVLGIMMVLCLHEILEISWKSHSGSATTGSSGERAYADRSPTCCNPCLLDPLILDLDDILVKMPVPCLSAPCIISPVEEH